ncbi:hypothetical protein DTO166G4_2580 [Paecilomyces variotii]|nr:hypothetical protein DTO166G4_2580 [Paecilomyces variotii]KAJ9240364.1 hypothetical protein DTO166G5_1702 [Paecilomyces variotii]
MNSLTRTYQSTTVLSSLSSTCIGGDRRQKIHMKYAVNFSLVYNLILNLEFYSQVYTLYSFGLTRVRQCFVLSSRVLSQLIDVLEAIGSLPGIAKCWVV